MLQILKKKNCFFLSVFNDHFQDIASFCPKFCYKISLNYLKFKGSEPKHSFTLFNLTRINFPFPRWQFLVWKINVVFLREINQCY